MKIIENDDTAEQCSSWSRFHFKDLTKDPFMVFMFVLMDKAMV